MFKKLLLLVVGAGLAAGGFFYYTNLPEEESEALVKSLSEQKVNLEKIADDIADSEVVRRTLEKGKQKLEQGRQKLQEGAAEIMDRAQAEKWLNSTVESYALETQDIDLSDAQVQELVDKLMALRGFSENAMAEQLAGEEPYTPEQQQRFEQIMEEGDAAFQEHLGVPLTHFLTTLSKSSFKQVIDPQN